VKQQLRCSCCAGFHGVNPVKYSDLPFGMFFQNSSERHRCSIIVEKMLKIRIPVQLPSLIREKSFNEPEQEKDPQKYLSRIWLVDNCACQRHSFGRTQRFDPDRQWQFRRFCIMLAFSTIIEPLRGSYTD